MATSALKASVKVAVKEYSVVIVFLTVAFLSVGHMQQSRIARALYTAVTRSDVDSVRAWLDGGADADTRWEHFNTPVLGKAAETGNTAIVKLLIDHGADLEAQSNEGLTPLMYAAVGRHAATVRLLLDNGANPRTQNQRGETALKKLLAMHPTAPASRNPDPHDQTQAIIGMLSQAESNGRQSAALQTKLKHKLRANRSPHGYAAWFLDMNNLPLFIPLYIIAAYLLGGVTIRVYETWRQQSRPDSEQLSTANPAEQSSTEDLP